MTYSPLYTTLPSKYSIGGVAYLEVSDEEGNVTEIQKHKYTSIGWIYQETVEENVTVSATAAERFEAIENDINDIDGNVAALTANTVKVADIDILVPGLTDGKIKLEHIPFSQYVNVYDVATQEGQDLLSPSTGDVLRRTDTRKFFTYNGTEWLEHYDVVESVNGRTGNVVVTKEDLDLDNVTNHAQVRKIAESVNGEIVVWSGTSGDSVASSGVNINEIVTVDLLDVSIPILVNGKVKDENLNADIVRKVENVLPDEVIPDNIPRLTNGKTLIEQLPDGAFHKRYVATSSSQMNAFANVPLHSVCFRSDESKVYLYTEVDNVRSWELFSILDSRTYATVNNILLGNSENYVTASTFNLFLDEFFTLDINNFPTVNPTLTYFFSRGIPLSNRFNASYLGDFNKVLRKSNGGAYLSNKIDLDYSGSGVCKGLFMEQADFNYLKGSYDFTTVNWVKENGTVSVQTAGEANSFIDGSATHAFAVQTDGIINSISQVKSLNDVSRSFSIFLKRTNNRYVLLHLFDNDVTSTFLKVYIDLIEGTATVLSTGIGNPSNLVSHVETVDKFDNRWLKVSIDIVEAVVSIDTFAIKLVNGLAETPYPLAGSSVLLANASLSQHGTKTIIPNLNQSQVNNYNFTFSATDLDFINTTEGCFLFEFIFYNISLMNTNDLDQQIFRIGTSTDNLELYYDDSANSLVLSTVNNSVTSSVSKSLAGISKGNDSVIRVAFNYVREESNTDVAEGLLEISVNGTATASNATVPYLVDFANKTMYLCNKDGSSHFSGWLREIVYYPKAQSNLNLLSKVS